LQVDLAKKDFYPDFNVQGMWQRTDPSQFRAYYQFTVGMRIPIYRTRRQRPELAQAESDRDRAKSELDAQSQQTAFQLRQQFYQRRKIRGTPEDLPRRLNPAGARHPPVWYGRLSIQSPGFPGLARLLLDVLKLDEEYWQTLSEHETSLAQMEEITGVSLR